MLSGIIPRDDPLRVYVLRPEYFLPATVVIFGADFAGYGQFVVDGGHRRGGVAGNRTDVLGFRRPGDRRSHHFGRHIRRQGSPAERYDQLLAAAIAWNESLHAPYPLHVVITTLPNDLRNADYFYRYCRSAAVKLQRMFRQPIRSG